MKKRIAVILSFWMPPLLQAHYYFHAESCSLGMTADSQLLRFSVMSQFCFSALSKFQKRQRQQ